GGRTDPTVNAAPEPAEGIEKWIVVDVERILRLPERLRRLWPRELLPHTGDGSPGAASAKEPGSGPAGGGVAGDLVADEPSQRELDVLTAWVAGFAAELNDVDARVTVVVSSGTETVHLALCLGGGSGQAVLALQGEGFEDLSGHQLLRRIASGRIGPVVERLTGLIEPDCVLTLGWARPEGGGRGASDTTAAAPPAGLAAGRRRDSSSSTAGTGAGTVRSSNVAATPSPSRPRPRPVTRRCGCCWPLSSLRR